MANDATGLGDGGIIRIKGPQPRAFLFGDGWSEERPDLVENDNEEGEENARQD